MRLTPLDIRKQEFSRGLRGYEADEVDAFLQMVSEQWEELLDEVRRKSEEIRDLEAKLVHYEKVEEALQEALQTARETSKKSIENAEQKASLMIQRAEARAEEITRDAEIERHEVKRETAKLSSRRSEIVTRLRAFLMSEIELLASYEGDDPVGFIKLLPADKKRLRQLSERLDEEPDEPSFRQDAPGAEGPRPAEGQSVSPPESMRAGGDAETSGAARSDDAGREPSATQSADAYDDDIPADVTAADHAEQKRYWYDSFEPDATPRTESHDEQHPDEHDEESDGPGWKTRTFVSNSADERRPAQTDDGNRDDEANADDETTTRASSEEIEKIRRILSDLD